MRWEEFVRSELAGMTPYSPGLRASQVRERSGKQRIVKLSSNEHPEGPFPSALAAIRSVARFVNRYPDGGSTALVGRLSERLGIPGEQLVVGNGSNEILRLVAQAVLRPGDEVVYSWPSFVVYPMVTRMFGAVPVEVRLDAEHAHDLGAMREAVTDRTRMVFLCNPNNPTGTIYGRDAFERFMDEIPDDVLVVADEAYFEFVRDPEYPDSMEWFDGSRPLVVARTFSKVYSLAGLRVGYAAMPAPLAEAVHKIREPFNANMVSQAAAYYSLEDQDEVARRSETNARLREELGRLLGELGATRAASETNFVFVATPKAKELFEGLLDEGVIVRGFGDAPALRIGIGTQEEMRIVEGALRRVAERVGGLSAADA